MNKTRIVSFLSFVLWGALVYLGVVVSTNAARQGQYSNLGQGKFYLMFPLAMAFLAACLSIFATKIPKPLLIALSLAQLALIPVYLFFYTGGV